VIARSSSEIHRLWSIRDDVEQTFRYGVPIVFDVSLPINAMGAYVKGIESSLAAQLPHSRLWVFGHMGDGNLHVLIQTAAGDATQHRQQIEAIVYDPLKGIAGSVSAEHGIGLEKKPYLHLSRSVAAIALMRRIKAALDPGNILNPGKIFDMADEADCP
jgi:FAD/FMN-containing dehydrogenase